MYWWDVASLHGNKGGIEASRRNRTIRTLVVDDSRIALQAMCSLLETLEFVQIIGTAGNGELALEKAQALSPDLILMDLEMAGMNGLEAASRLRELVPETLVIVVTVHDNPEVKQACRAAGAVGFVPKSRVHLDLAGEILRLFMGSVPPNS